MTRSSLHMQVMNEVPLVEEAIKIASQAIMTEAQGLDTGRKRERLSEDDPPSYSFHSRKLRLSWKRHNLMVSLLYISPLSFLFLKIWRHIVFSREQHFGKIDAKRLDGLVRKGDHRTKG